MDEPIDGRICHRFIGRGAIHECVIQPGKLPKDAYVECYNSTGRMDRFRLMMLTVDPLRRKRNRELFLFNKQQTQQNLPLPAVFL